MPLSTSEELISDSSVDIVNPEILDIVNQSDGDTRTVTLATRADVDEVSTPAVHVAEKSLRKNGPVAVSFFDFFDFF